MEIKKYLMRWEQSRWEQSDCSPFPSSPQMRERCRRRRGVEEVLKKHHHPLTPPLPPPCLADSTSLLWQEGLRRGGIGAEDFENLFGAFNYFTIKIV